MAITVSNKLPQWMQDWVDKLERLAKKKKKSPEYEKSPTEHGFMDECMEKNKDKDDPGAYCAAIVDRAKGTTDWRKGPRDKDEK